MEKIKITFLGTSNAIPTRKRSHTAILLQYKNENILVDCGEGTQRQFRIAGISPSRLTRILITHWHGDHFFGLPGLLQTLAMNDYKKTLEIYGPRGTKYFIHLLKKLANIRVNLKVHEVSGKFFDSSEFFIQGEHMRHDIPTLAYAFVIKDKRRLDKKKIQKLKLPNSSLLRKLQQGHDVIIDDRKIKASQISYIEKGRKVSFILDSAQNSNTVKIAENSDVLICEASFLNDEEKLAEEYKHLTAQQAATIAKKAKVKKLILTHISQRYEHDTKPILDEAKKVFKNTTLAKDFDAVEV